MFDDSPRDDVTGWEPCRSVTLCRCGREAALRGKCFSCIREETADTLPPSAMPANDVDAVLAVVLAEDFKPAPARITMSQAARIRRMVDDEGCSWNEARATVLAECASSMCKGPAEVDSGSFGKVCRGCMSAIENTVGT